MVGAVQPSETSTTILVSVEGPIFLGLEEVTGEGSTGEDIARQFEAKLNELGAEITKRVLIGVTCKHSANRGYSRPDISISFGSDAPRMRSHQYCSKSG